MVRSLLWLPGFKEWRRFLAVGCFSSKVKGAGVILHFLLNSHEQLTPVLTVSFEDPSTRTNILTHVYTTQAYIYIPHDAYTALTHIPCTNTCL